MTKSASVSVAKAAAESETAKSKVRKAPVDRTNERPETVYDREHLGAKSLRKLDDLERHMARLVNRVQALEAALGRPVLDETSEHVVSEGSTKKSRKAAKKLAASVRDAVRADGNNGATDEPEAKVRKKREYTDEERAAIGVRLQSARAAKLGMTYDELKGLTTKVRPGQTELTEVQLEEVEAMREATPKAKKPKTSKKTKKPAAPLYD